MELVTKEDWEEFCSYTEIFENLYWEGCGVIREMKGRTAIIPILPATVRTVRQTF
jgi:hypothetical protein